MIKIIQIIALIGTISLLNCTNYMERQPIPKYRVMTYNAKGDKVGYSWVYRDQIRHYDRKGNFIGKSM